MKSTSHRMRQLLAVLALAACFAVTLPVSAQPAIDAAAGVPQLMVVNSVNAEAGTVTLNGNTYRVATEKQPSRAMLSATGRALQVSDLEPGMEIVVSTDGTEPGAANEPAVLGMWAPD